MIARACRRMCLALAVLTSISLHTSVGLECVHAESITIEGYVFVVDSNREELEVRVYMEETTFVCKTDVEDDGHYRLEMPPQTKYIKLVYRSRKGTVHSDQITRLAGDRPHTISKVLIGSNSDLAIEEPRREDLLAQAESIIHSMLANQPASEVRASFVPEIKHFADSLRETPTVASAMRAERLVGAFKEADRLGHARFSDDGGYLARIDRHGNLEIAEAGNAIEWRHLAALQPFEDIAFVSDNRLFANHGCHQPLRYWGGDEAKELFLPAGMDKFLAVSPKGEIVAASGANGSLNVIRVDSGEVVGRFQTGVFSATAADISSDGRWLAAGTLVGDVYIWDLSSNEQTAHTRLEENFVNALRFSPNGSRVVVGTGFGAEGAVVQLAWDGEKLEHAASPIPTQGGAIDVGVSDVSGKYYVFGTTEGGRKAAVWENDGSSVQEFSNVGGTIDVFKDGRVAIPGKGTEGLEILKMRE